MQSRRRGALLALVCSMGLCGCAAFLSDDFRIASDAGVMGADGADDVALSPDANRNSGTDGAAINNPDGNSQDTLGVAVIDDADSMAAVVADSADVSDAVFDATLIEAAPPDAPTGWMPPAYVPPDTPWMPPAVCTPHRPPGTYTNDLCTGAVVEVPTQYYVVLQQPFMPNGGIYGSCGIGARSSQPTPAACECGNTYTCDCIAASGAACGGSAGMGASFVKACYPGDIGAWVIECQ